MADASAALERHPTLYFPDGDITLSAVTKAGIAQVFRVDRIFLARHSEVFRDMFAVSSDTTSASESYDDVPLVTLPADDIAEDVQSLLEVMYNIAALHQKLSTRRRADTPLTTTGLLRIAKKYLVKDVEDAVVQHVIMEWPNTLEEWDRRAAELKDIRRTSVCSHPEPVSAIKFASSYGVLSSIRQSAFYQLSITPTYNEWHETLQIQIPHKALDNICARWSLLSATELLVFMQGRDAMVHFVLEQVKTVLSPTTVTRNTGFAGAKISPVKCDCKPGTFALVHQAHFGTGPNVDFLNELRLLEEKCINEQLGICNKCKDRIAAAIPELRVKIWRKLPEFFPTPTAADL